MSSIISLSDFACGLIAGWSQVIIGQPFDFIKMKFQTSANHGSIRHWIREIYHEFGFKGFYRGSSSIFVGFGGIIAMEFTVFQLCKRQLKKFNGFDNNDELGLKLIALSGGIVGLTTSFIYCPIQYAKLMIQSRKYTINTKQIGSLNALFQIFMEQGLLRGTSTIYRGFASTIAREIPGSAIYYGTYEGTLKVLTRGNRNQARKIDYLLSGACSGIIYWTLSYPSDVVKTLVQTSKQSYLSIIKRCIFQRKLYRGFSIVLIRCIPVNSISFFMYQSMQELIRNSKAQLIGLQ